TRPAARSHPSPLPLRLPRLFAGVVAAAGRYRPADARLRHLVGTSGAHPAGAEPPAGADRLHDGPGERDVSRSSVFSGDTRADRSASEDIPVAQGVGG